MALGNLFEQSLDEILASPRAKAIYDGFTSHKCREDLCKRCMRAGYYRNAEGRGQSAEGKGQNAE